MVSNSERLIPLLCLISHFIFVQRAILKKNHTEQAVLHPMRNHLFIFYITFIGKITALRSDRYLPSTL